MTGVKNTPKLVWWLSEQWIEVGVNLDLRCNVTFLKCCFFHFTFVNMLEALSQMAYGASAAAFFMYFANKYFQANLTTTPKKVLWFAIICLALGLMLGFSHSDFVRGFQAGFNGAAQPK